VINLLIKTMIKILNLPVIGFRQMLVHATDRGTELGKLRQDQVLTDVILVSDDTEIHAHKLLLSLHSFYFRNKSHNFFSSFFLFFFKVLTVFTGFRSLAFKK